VPPRFRGDLVDLVGVASDLGMLASTCVYLMAEKSSDLLNLESVCSLADVC
jgi:hypothetical protein